jgi:GDPmannose 4,6-dehydratase
VNLDYKDYVLQDPKFYRPAEVDLLISDPSRARKILKWEPSVSFRGLVEMMVQSDLKQLSNLHKETLENRL